MKYFPKKITALVKTLSTFIFVVYFAFSSLLVFIFNTGLASAGKHHTSIPNITDISYVKSGGALVAGKLKIDMVDATITEDYGAGAEQMKFIDGEYVDNKPSDDNMRFEHPTGSCDGNHSEIKFVGAGDIDGVQSPTGWVGQFYFQNGDECVGMITDLKAPSGSPVKDDHGRWVDRAFVVYQDKKYSNTNLFDDGNHTYKDNSNGCDSYIKVEDYINKGDRANLIYRQKNGTGQCLVFGAMEISLNDAARRDIVSYFYKKGGKDTIFVPISLDIDNEATTAQISPYQTGSRFYQQLPDTDDRHDADQFWELADDGTYGDFDAGSFGRIFKSSETLQMQGCQKRHCNGDFYFSVHRMVSEDPPKEYEGTTVNPDDGGGSEGAPAKPTCESVNDTVIIGWIICSTIGAVDSGVQKLANVAENMLDINAQDVRNNEELRAVWSYFRATATFLLLAVGLAMVISQAAGGNS